MIHTYVWVRQLTTTKYQRVMKVGSAFVMLEADRNRTDK